MSSSSKKSIYILNDPVLNLVSKFLVPLTGLKVPEYLYQLELPNVELQFRKAKNVSPHVQDQQQAFNIIVSGLANSCGGTVEVFSQSRKPINVLEYDLWRSTLKDRLIRFFPDAVSCVVPYKNDTGTFLCVLPSPTFVTTDSHLYTRGLAETKKAVTHEEIASVINTKAGAVASKVTFEKQELAYGAKCSFVESKTLEYKCFSVSNVRDIVKRLASPGSTRGIHMCLSLANLPTGGDLILGIKETQDGAIILVGQEVEPKEEALLRNLFAELFSVNSFGQPRIWCNPTVKPKEGIHWSCNFIPLGSPPYQCNPRCSKCPHQKRRVLVHIHFPHCPGGVFSRLPEAYQMRDNGEIYPLAFQEWKSLHTSEKKMEEIPVKRLQSQALRSVIETTQPSYSLAPVFKENTTLKFSKHSHVVKDFPKHTSAKISFLHPDKMDLFEMRQPFNYTPSRAVIEAYLKSASALEKIESVVGEQPAFCISADSLLSCLSLDESMANIQQRPNYHIMDILAVSEKATMHLFGVGKISANEISEESADIFNVARILKKRVVKFGSPAGNSHTVFVKCYIVSVDGSVLETVSSESTSTLGIIPSSVQLGVSEICTAMTKVLSSVPSHFRDSIHHSCSLDEDQREILEGKDRYKYMFITGPPGCGKTTLAMHLCETLGKQNCLYMSASETLANFVRASIQVKSRHVSSGEDLSQNVKSSQEKYLLIDDAQNLSYPEPVYEDIFDNIKNSDKQLFVFGDSNYQNYLSSPNLDTFEQFHSKNKEYYDSYCYKGMTVIRRNSQIVAQFMLSNISDITRYKGREGKQKRFKHGIQCESLVEGDDVTIKHVKSIFDTENNGLLEHVKGLVGEPNVDPHRMHYSVRDIAVLMDSVDGHNLQHQRSVIHEIFKTLWPESLVQDASVFPIRGIVVDSLDNFMGLEARVVVFVLPKEPSDEISTGRSIHNPKYKIAIASRAIDRVDFIQEEPLEVSRVHALKFSQYPTDFLQQPTEGMEVLSPEEFDLEVQGIQLSPDDAKYTACMLWEIFIKEQLSHFAEVPNLIFLCYPLADDPHQCVSCVTSDGCVTPSPLPPPTGKPWAISANPQTNDVALVCEDRYDETRYLLAHYRAQEVPDSWSTPTLHGVVGAWSNSSPPCVTWLDDTEVVISISDRDSVCWIVTLNMVTCQELQRVKTECVGITDMSVTREGDAVYVSDPHSQRICVFTRTLDLLHAFSLASPDPDRSLSNPVSICAVSGGRVLVCHKDQHGTEESLSVTLWSREGGYLRDIITCLPGQTSRVYVNENSEQLLLSTTNGQLRKYDITGLI